MPKFREEGWVFRHESNCPYQIWTPFKPDDYVEVSCFTYSDDDETLKGYVKDFWWGWSDIYGWDSCIRSARKISPPKKETPENNVTKTTSKGFEAYLKEEVERFSPRFDRILYDFAEVKDVQKILRYLEEAYNRGLKEGYQQGRERDYEV
jgi:hypothetical protein